MNIPNLPVGLLNEIHKWNSIFQYGDDNKLQDAYYIAHYTSYLLTN